jgi:hypothetical protein
LTLEKAYLTQRLVPDVQVDVPSDKGYAGKGLGTPHSSLDMAGGQYSPLETEELHSKLEVSYCSIPAKPRQEAIF